MQKQHVLITVKDINLDLDSVNTSRMLIRNECSLSNSQVSSVLQLQSTLGDLTPRVKALANQKAPIPKQVLTRLEMQLLLHSPSQMTVKRSLVGGKSHASIVA